MHANRPFRHGLTLASGGQSAHRTDLAHLDGITVEAGMDAVQGEDVAVESDHASAFRSLLAWKSAQYRRTRQVDIFA